jgi:hypothetical protein
MTTVTQTYNTNATLFQLCVVNLYFNVINLHPTTTSYVINENTASHPITCSAQCRPDCMYQWTGPNYSSSNDRLQFTSISRVHQGSYACTAKNGYGDISSSAVDLIVHSKYFNLYLLDFFPVLSVCYFLFFILYAVI